MKEESTYRDLVIKHILPNCVRPGRYVGNELNSFHKNWDEALIKIALVFPDAYEVGQSGLGLKILYSLLGREKDVLIERAFSPWIDAEGELRRNEIPLFTIESMRPLRDFDLIGFTLPYEMTYTNVLNILELSHIPSLSEERDDRYPLIAGGGSCALNPEPLADFFDFFVLGEGEEVILEILSTIREWKLHSKDRITALEELVKLDGIYVPRFYHVNYGRISSNFGVVTPSEKKYPRWIKKRVVSNFDTCFYPTSPIVPFIETVHDRISLEIFRGCTRGCRFCQAGMIYRPVRERSIETLIGLSRESIRNTGYEEISLVSLSCSDYGRISGLAYSLLKEYERRYLEISLPSLRIDSFSLELAKLVQRGRRTTLTFAPEVGTQRMRDIINKGVTEEDVLNTMMLAKSEGWKTVKLYFLIGLPGEEEEDVRGICRLVFKILQKTGLRINISLSSFIPKSWTAFQWDCFEEIETLREKFSIIKSQLRHGKIHITFHNPQLSFLEALFARGDRSLGRLLLEARKLGRRFDGWNDHFHFNDWIAALQNSGIDAVRFTGNREIEDPLPWDHCGCGVMKDFLKEERKRASQGARTEDCRYGHCEDCGVCGGNIRTEVFLQDVRGDSADLAARSHPPAARMRMRYTKEEPLRFISHLDLLRTIQRALRRADLPVSYTEGFHPHMRISFGPALPLGYTSSAEWMDLDISEYVAASQVLSRLNEVLPEGMKVLEAREIPAISPTLSNIIQRAVYRADISPGVETGPLQEAIKAILEKDTILIEKKGRDFDIRPLIDAIELPAMKEGISAIKISLRILATGSAKPSDILQILNSYGASFDVTGIERTGMYSPTGSLWGEP